MTALRRFGRTLAMAGAALLAHKLRSFLTLLGVIIGVAALITMVAAGTGAQLRVAEQIRSLGANLLVVYPSVAREGGARLEAGSRPTLTEPDARAIAGNVGFIAVAAPSVRGSAQIINANRNWRTVVNGTTSDYFIAREWPLAEGRHFTAEDLASAAKVALLGTAVAEQLFAEGVSPVGQTIRINETPFTVAGVLESKGSGAMGHDQDDVVFVPISTAKLRLFGSAHETDRQAVAYILAKVHEASDMQAAEAQVSRLLRARHRLAADDSDDFEIRNPAAAMKARQQATRTISLMLGALASVALLVGGVGIMNVMLVSVTERTWEIGLRMAVGARRSDVRLQFLLEAVLLCLAGGVIGLLVGAGAAVALATWAGWPVFIGPGSAAVAILFSAVVGICFGLYPAVKASRLDPVTALREGEA